MKVLYRIFIECSEYTLDAYWKQIFDDCSIGKFPRGSGYDQASKAVHVRSGKKVAWFKLTNDGGELLSVQEIFLNLKSLFQSYLFLRSKQDNKDITAELEVSKQELTESYAKDWKFIKKKKLKESIVRQFVLRKEDQLSLTHDETVALAKLLKLALLFNWIVPTNITYSNKHIAKINNLKFNKKTRQFFIDYDIVDCKRDFKYKEHKMSELFHKNLACPKNRYIL